MKFWNIENEVDFFKKSLELTDKSNLFYQIKDNFLAYIPKKIEHSQTLQSRNAFIGAFTEKWVKKFLEPIAKSKGLYCINGVVCEELGLTNRSPADIAFCVTNEKVQTQENIKAIFEVKMSIVNNYFFNTKTNKIEFIGDYTTHKGNPSLLRSDSMLKAIGKLLNVRLKNIKNFIPLFVLGNTPITKTYEKDVDLLKKRGIIQGFINLYPDITPKKVSATPSKGFVTFNNYKELNKFILEFLDKKYVYISKAISKEKLEEILGKDVEEFLQKIREIDD